MATRQNASKRAAQYSSCSNLCTPTKAVKSKIHKPNTPMMQTNTKEEGNDNEMKQIYDMFKTVMTKLEKLDSIETDLKEIKTSLEYAHAEIKDLKKENETMKADQAKSSERIQNLERNNNTLRDKVIDLQARSMRDNLLFFNMPENDKENTTEMIHELLETKMGMEDARNNVKIDRSHRIGRRKEGNRKPRPIVVKFNYHQDREFVRLNARKLKGTTIGVSEQFPEEIETIRKSLYPELKKAKSEGKRARIVKDKLIIEGQVFNFNRC
ncbi:protein unc-13 homolog C-like [Dendronephthya gigantea]|uniref:protein unc-13 homolog C-like n=1 Tax=Dendronephthya gigantea TaxID=151771 RepID=UPI00106DAEFF|nr:protein unc-13 homolog C-like [Dendronephthya gigantea]